MRQCEIKPGLPYRGKSGPKRWVVRIQGWASYRAVTYRKGDEAQTHICSLAAFADWASEVVDAPE